MQLVIVTTNGEETLPPQLYWKSMLPNTPMPKAITNLLHPSKYHTLKLFMDQSKNFYHTF